MKKKAIEKIPYLTLPKVSRKKMVEYIGGTIRLARTSLW